MTNQDPQEELRSTLEQLLGAVCSLPRDAGVRLMPSAHRPILVLSCATTDYGAVLGKKGSMLHAFRVVAASVGARSNLVPHVTLDEATCVHRDQKRGPFTADPDWDPAELEKLASLLAHELFPAAQVAVEKVSTGTSRLTVTVTDGECPVPREELEKALQSILNTAATLQGQKLLVELVAETAPAL